MPDDAFKMRQEARRQKRFRAADKAGASVRSASEQPQPTRHNRSGIELNPLDNAPSADLEAAERKLFEGGGQQRSQLLPIGGFRKRAASIAIEHPAAELPSQSAGPSFQRSSSRTGTAGRGERPTELPPLKSPMSGRGRPKGTKSPQEEPSQASPSAAKPRDRQSPLQNSPYRNPRPPGSLPPEGCKYPPQEQSQAAPSAAKQRDRQSPLRTPPYQNPRVPSSEPPAERRKVNPAGRKIVGAAADASSDVSTNDVSTNDVSARSS